MGRGGAGRQRVTIFCQTDLHRFLLEEQKGTTCKMIHIERKHLEVTM